MKQPETVKMITKFSAHHNQLRSLLSDHWHLLTDHHILRKYVRPTPELVFCRATSVGDRLTGSHKGHRSTFRCGHFTRCPGVQEGTTFLLPNGEHFSSFTHVNCGTKGVIYLMVCTCDAFNVGKTIRELQKRIGDHLYYSSNGKLTTVGHYIGLHHRFKPEVVKFIVLKVIPEDLRRGVIGIEQSSNRKPYGLSDSTPTSPQV